MRVACDTWSYNAGFIWRPTHCATAGYNRYKRFPCISTNPANTCFDRRCRTAKLIGFRAISNGQIRSSKFPIQGGVLYQWVLADPQQPDKQISQIEKSVTHLLVATKQLLETLTQWSRKQATEEEVSDVYVRLGYEFNLACRAFSAIGVETADLGPVPDLLRNILEDTLSQNASPQSLDRFLPRIRDIIINLLHGLKRKQAKLRSRSNKDSRSSMAQTGGRQPSGGSLGSNETGLSRMLDDTPVEVSQRAQAGRNGTAGDVADESNSTVSRPAPPGRSTPTERTRRDTQRSTAQSNSSSSISSTGMQNIPVLSPNEEPQSRTQNPLTNPSGFPPPPPPPKQQDALAALQRGGDLERRASRRFSAYQISKHLGASPNGIPVLPPTQNSPIPNRGRDVRESMRAVQSRGSVRHSRQRSNYRTSESSPQRQGQITQPISEEIKEDLQPPRIHPPTEPSIDDSPTAKTPDDKYKPVNQLDSRDIPNLAATLTGPPSTEPEILPSPDVAERPVSPKKTPHTAGLPATKAQGFPSHTYVSSATSTPPQSQQFSLEDSPPPGNQITLFLQYKSKIKKFVLPEGYEGLTVARLQLAFIEKFAWNTHHNGVDLPEIYIQDPVSGVRHELEDLADVKDRSVLVLNVEVLDEVKKHFDDGMDSVRQVLEGVRGMVDNQGVMMQRFSDRQLEASKDMARIAASPSTQMNAPRLRSIKSSRLRGNPDSGASATSVAELQVLRRDIAVLRQTCSNMSTDFAASIDSIRAKGDNVKSVAGVAALPTFQGDTGRVHVNNGKKALSKDSETLVNRVDDLSDLVEDLRKDVVTRGVRPLPRQLENVSKDISATVKELAKLKEFIRREKPVWTKIWEKELDLVCQERDELTQQEELMTDLHGDIEDLTGVFKLVEEATRQQNLQSGPTIGMRSSSRSLPIDPDIDPHAAKDGVLGEVRALQPNHENRLEAIERAERARQKELESRKGGEFQREVANFVEEGKLKKTGGAEEVERLRKVKDEKARKENWERVAQRKAEMEETERQAAEMPQSEAAEDEENSGATITDGNEETDGADSAVMREGEQIQTTEVQAPPNSTLSCPEQTICIMPAC